MQKQTFPTVGFFSQASKSGPRRKLGKPSVLPEDSTKIPESETLLRFGSKRALTFEQALRSVLVIGSTGSGKTESVVTPVISKLIASGCPGVIFDVKGNLRRYVRALAKAHGRLGDVVEFGSAEGANRCNILAGMADHEIQDLMNAFAIDGVESDHNIAWHQKGARIGTDVLRLLDKLSMNGGDCHFSRQFRPTLSKLFSVIINRPLAAGLWSFFTRDLEDRKSLLRARNAEPTDYVVSADALRRQVMSEYFHLLKPLASEQKQKDQTTYEQNISWSLERLNRSLKLMKHTHGILDRFSCEDERAVPLDFDELVYRQRKIVLVHFAMDSGYAGALISKCIKERFYQSVMRNGLDNPGYTFMIGDEYQHIVDVSRTSRMNDMEFFSLSREFRNINVIATQSIASLRANGNLEAVTALVANCMTKIMLQTSDPETIAWISTFRPLGAAVKVLKRGACLLECFNSRGDSLSTVDDLNGAYAATRTILAGARSEEHAEAGEEPASPCRMGDTGFPLAIESALIEAALPDMGMGGSSGVSKDKHIVMHLALMRAMSSEDLPYWDGEARRMYAKKHRLGDAWKTWEEKNSSGEEEKERKRKKRRKQDDDEEDYGSAYVPPRTAPKKEED